MAEEAGSGFWWYETGELELAAEGELAGPWTDSMQRSSEKSEGAFR